MDMPAPLNVVYFAHGKESGPWGHKIRRLARIARTLGFDVESPDYQDTQDPDERVEQLLALHPRAMDNLVLVGSSMGGYVAAEASALLEPAGLFLMAPAVHLAGFGNHIPVPKARTMVAVHGWNDPVVPVENAIRFCGDNRIQLHLLDCGHTLIRRMAEVETLFAAFLRRVVRET